MNFEINNIGKVKHAAIEMNALTVIVGANDSGKSTIGKSLYSVVHSASVTKNASGEDREEKMTSAVKKFYEHILPIRFSDDRLMSLLPITPEMLVRQLMVLEGESGIMIFFNRLIEVFSSMDMTPQMRSVLIGDVKNIQNVASVMPAEDLMIKSLSDVLKSEFSGNVTTYGHQDSSILLTEAGAPKPVIDCRLMDGRIEKLDNDFSAGVPYVDATYVESPLYMQQIRYVMNTVTMKGLHSMLPMHVVDLAEKLNTQFIYDDLSDGKKYENVQEIIGGHFEYDHNSGALVMSRNNQVVPITNVASGLKSFGMLQMLLELGAIANDKVLIWDEPENHMHPQWQLNFAEVLVQMAKDGYPILITTHSPYFLQALRFYSSLYGLEKYVNYYASKNSTDDGLSEFKDVTNCLNEVFLTLAEPLNQVMNVDYVRNQKA